MRTNYEQAKYEAANLIDVGMKRDSIRAFLFEEAKNGKITMTEAVEILDDLDPEDGEFTNY